MARLMTGDRVVLYGAELRVCVTPEDKSDCQECQIHHLCNRDARPINELAMKYDETGCLGLIGNRRHFKILR